MARNETVVITIDIWEKGGKESGYSLMMGWDGCVAIELCSRKYKKDLLPLRQEYRRMLKQIHSDDKLKILHQIHKLARGGTK